MRTFTFKGLFLTALLGCLSIQAADADLITKQITIKLEEAGTLPNKIGSSKKNLITNLKIVGEINGTDWKMIREMAGRNCRGGVTSGNLSVLDLSEAKIVKGGDYYYDDNGYYYDDYGQNGYIYGYCYTSNDAIGRSAFRNCSGLTSINLPASITYIGRAAFEGCSRLTSINLPAGITEISSSTFEGCSGLTSINLPASITKIGYYSFKGCSGLTNINLPASITKICYGAFRDCSGLTSIYVYAEKVPKIGSDVFYYVDKKNCTLYVPQGTETDYFLANVWGEFVNIVEFEATDIDKTTTSTNVEEVSRYSVNGQRLATPTKGLNIVKYSDGSVKKVVVE